MRRGGTGRRWSAWTAAALAAGLVVSGCSKSDDDKDTKSDQGGAAGTASAGQSGGGSPAPGKPDPNSAQATWTALIDAMAAQKVFEFHTVQTAAGKVDAETAVQDELWSWFDAGNKTIFTDRSTITKPGGNASRRTCVDNFQWSYLPAVQKWNKTIQSCSTAQFQGGENVGDGILVPGLTPEQGKAFGTAVAALPGWLTPSAVSTVEQGGKNYLKLTVDLKPQQSGPGKTENTRYLFDAVRAANPDALRSPYLVENNERASGSPVQAVFWLDPATKLPVYSELATTVVDKGVPTGATRQRRTEYVFGSAQPKPDFSAPTAVPPLKWPDMGTKPPAAT
ncbi:hypothetical protein [Streptomyces sp. SID3343]|uniref:hypothetical protein n=1 Tax=Streptomyces sp. SID3343 TaxID=2690260 RepID=UPI00136EF989|nr:hypothetical protein [Streptomyces sp. SID3343]MYW06188.1 hypothetical protein [Streptomyces sp. SID3343]